jgi:hypothetical protein
MDIKERMARQMRMASEKAHSRKVSAEKKPAVDDRIAKQIHRAKVDSAVAAMKTPPPDFVYKEPRMPRTKQSEADVVRRFIEDRSYDDIPPEKGGLDKSRVNGMTYVRAAIIAEQPREFVVGPRDQGIKGGKSFGNIGMENLEGPGYSELHKDEGKDDERIITEPESTSAPKIEGIKIDLSGAFAAQPKPASRKKTPPPPIAEESGKGDNPIEMNTAQKQMLAAMRAQRNAKHL